jgi:hypothetical protein
MVPEQQASRDCALLANDQSTNSRLSETELRLLALTSIGLPALS